MLLTYPSNNHFAGNMASVTNATIADTNDKLAFMLTVPKTGTLARIGFLTGLTGFTTAADISVRIETISAKLPTGTLYDANGTGSVTSPVGATWYRPQINGATGITVTKNDRIAVVLSCPSGSPNLTIVRKLGSLGDGYGSVQMATWATSWTENAGDLPPFAIEYSDGSCPNIGACPINALTTTRSFHQGTTGTTTGDECGLRMTLPFGGNCIGVQACVDMIGFPKYCLYSGTTLIASTPDYGQNLFNRTTGQMAQYYWTTPVALSAGQPYTVTLRPYNISTNSVLAESTIDQAAYLEALGLDPTDGQTSRVDLGAWEAVNSLRVPMLGLLFDSVASGGGRGRPPIYGV